MLEPVPIAHWIPWRTALVGGLLGVVLAISWEFVYTMLGSNLREVVPGRLYRAAQPDRALLAEARRRYGVRTVLSLRGVCDGDPWYAEEMTAAEDLGLSLELVGLSAGRLPSTTAARNLCEILDHAEPPLLVHCQRGIDRTGLVSGLYLLLRTDASLDQARGQLSLRYLHLSIGRTRAMDRFLDLYAGWLGEQRLVHTPDHLRRWLLREYRPPEGLAEIDLVEPCESGRVRIARATPTALPVRVWNRARGDLHLAPAPAGGMSLHWALFRPDRSLVAAQPGGMRRAIVAPGKSIDLCVYLPPITRPGRYQLAVELSDDRVGSFCMFGSDPLFVELEVP